MHRNINDEYFEWLFDLMCDRRFGRGISYRKLLTRLHNIEFTYSIPLDQNRAEDGVNLRHRYASTHEYYDYDLIMNELVGPCSVLEMMVALAIRCEENIMDNPNVGDRTTQWFWSMVTNLGLGYMYDDEFDQELVDDKVRIFLCRDYEPNGEGGLFTINNCRYDLRTVEIWHQLCWYLDTIT